MIIVPIEIQKVLVEEDVIFFNDNKFILLIEAELFKIISFLLSLNVVDIKLIKK